MTEKPNRIFLSYAREDSAKVETVYHKLEEAHFSPWMDTKNLLTGQTWDKVTKEALKTAALVIIFLSNRSIRKRGYFQREIKIALDLQKEMPEGKDFIFPARLESCKVPNNLAGFHYCDLFEKDGFETLLNSIKKQIVVEPLIPSDLVEKSSSPDKLRKVTLKKLSETAVKGMLKSNDFYDSQEHPAGKGIAHEYELKSINNNQLVIDHTTNLMWQQSGSTDSKTFPQAKVYIEGLNRDILFVYSNWRLPTLEEAMSLMEAERNSSDLFINEVFNDAQEIVWTCDHYNNRGIWKVDYGDGSCFGFHVGNDLPRCKIRAVRSMDD